MPSKLQRSGSLTSRRPIDASDMGAASSVKQARHAAACMIYLIEHWGFTQKICCVSFEHMHRGMHS